MTTSVWNNSYNQAKYGTGNPGTAADWRDAYNQTVSEEEADKVLSSGSETPHGILGLARDVKSEVVIKRAYRNLVKRECNSAFGLHPNPRAVARFKKVNAAYSKLMAMIGA